MSGSDEERALGYFAPLRPEPWYRRLWQRVMWRMWRHRQWTQIGATEYEDDDLP